MKNNLKVAFSLLLVSVLLVFSVSAVNFSPIYFSKLNDKYQYVYKITATKPIDSEVCLVAELVSDKDDVYCDFKISEVIFGECDDGEIRVKLPKRK